MARKVEVDGQTYIHEEDVVEYVSEDKLVFDDIAEMCEYIMDNSDGFAWTSWDAMVEWFQDSRDTLDELVKDVGGKMATSAVITSEDGKLKFQVIAGPDSIVVKDMTPMGNYLMHITPLGVEMQGGYNGAVARVRSKDGDPYGAVRDSNDNAWSPSGQKLTNLIPPLAPKENSKADKTMEAVKAALLGPTPTRAVAIDDAALGAIRATAMWTPDGVTVSAKGKGVKSAPTLVKAIEGFTDG